MKDQGGRAGKEPGGFDCARVFAWLLAFSLRFLFFPVFRCAVGPACSGPSAGLMSARPVSAWIQASPFVGKPRTPWALLFGFRAEGEGACKCCRCKLPAMGNMSPLWGLNPRPYAYEAHALPAELRRRCQMTEEDQDSAGACHVAFKGRLESFRHPDSSPGRSGESRVS